MIITAQFFQTFILEKVHPTFVKGIVRESRQTFLRFSHETFPIDWRSCSGRSMWINFCFSVVRVSLKAQEKSSRKKLVEQHSPTLFVLSSFLPLIWLHESQNSAETKEETKKISSESFSGVIFKPRTAFNFTLIVVFFAVLIYPVKSLICFVFASLKIAKVVRALKLRLKLQFA